MRAALSCVAAVLCAACASTPTPTVLAEAAARLDSREAVNLTSVRPGLMREARDHLLRARRAVLEEDADAAELYGHLALQRYETAAGFTARDLITARLGAMDAALDRITAEADALASERAALRKARDAEARREPTPPAPTATAPTATAPPTSPPPAPADPAGAAAEAAIVEARTRRATAIGAGRDRRCPDVFRGADALIELAIDRQAAGAAPAALTAATRAQERLDACDGASVEALAPAVDPAARLAAEQAITAAQQALARARAAGMASSRTGAGAGLIDDARGWYGAGVWAPATTLAEQAGALLAPVEGAVDPIAAEARAAVARSRAVGHRYGDRRTDPLYVAAAAMQADAERALAGGRHEEALRVAEQAAATWLAIGPASSKTAPEAPGGSPAVGAALTAVGVAAAAPSTAEADWRPAYREILGTLALRDRADALAASPAARAALDGGNRELAAARRAYESGDYGEARRSAARAAAELRAAISGAPSPSAPAAAASVDTPADAPAAATPAAAPPEPAPQREDLRRIAEAAARDAVAQAAADRAAAERAARARQDATERAEAERRLAEARAAEASARAALAAAEARNREQAEARDAEDAAQLAAARARVDSARERQVLCLKLGCPARDPTAWARAEEALRTAADALAAESAETALRAAERAIGLMDEAAARPAPFTVPADQAEVSRDGDRLRLRTRLRFESGRDGLRPEAGPALDALARVINENEGAIRRVRLVGFTDDRGSAASNRALSARRAEAVRRALIARGVPADRLVAEGRGEADPAFDNRTLEGRLKNRRVEIRLELQEAP